MLKRTRVLFVAVSLLALLAPGTATAAKGGDYTVTNLVSDQLDVAAHLDPNLVNAWGLAAGPMTPWWVADADADVSTLYPADGTPLPLVVDVSGGPTGLVFNGSGGFVVTDGIDSGSSLFLFATEEGMIRGWSPAVPPPPLVDPDVRRLRRIGRGRQLQGPRDCLDRRRDDAVRRRLP
jgi:hypothetical protein